MEDKYFLVQIKRTNGVYTKGVVVKDSEDDAKQGFHAYMRAYAYGHENGTDYVQAAITAMDGRVVLSSMWYARTEPVEEIPNE